MLELLPLRPLEIHPREYLEDRKAEPMLVDGDLRLEEGVHHRVPNRNDLAGADAERDQVPLVLEIQQPDARRPQVVALPDPDGHHRLRGGEGGSWSIAVTCEVRLEGDQRSQHAAARKQLEAYRGEADLPFPGTQQVVGGRRNR